MLYEQKAMVHNITQDAKIYFFDHTFRTAYVWADIYMEKNKKDKLKLYYKNYFGVGKRWILQKI